MTLEMHKEIHLTLSEERREQFKSVLLIIFYLLILITGSRWLNETLANKNPKSLSIVMGHHAMESASLVHGPRPFLNMNLRPILRQYNVDLYICGHDHNLQHIHKNFEPMHHVVSGGGGFVTGAPSLHPVFQSNEYPGIKFAEATFGFIAATASKNTLHLDFVDYWGKIIYNTTINPVVS